MLLMMMMMKGNWLSMPTLINRHVHFSSKRANPCFTDM
jgi:hypothetical protein